MSEEQSGGDITRSGVRQRFWMRRAATRRPVCSVLRCARVLTDWVCAMKPLLRLASLACFAAPTFLLGQAAAPHQSCNGSIGSPGSAGSGPLSSTSTRSWRTRQETGTRPCSRPSESGSAHSTCDCRMGAACSVWACRRTSRCCPRPPESEPDVMRCWTGRLSIWPVCRTVLLAVVGRRHRASASQFRFGGHAGADELN
jgi:hypothetical protein